MQYEVAKIPKDMVPVVISFTSGKTEDLFFYPLWGVSKIRSLCPNAELLLNLERDTCEKSALPFYDSYYGAVGQLIRDVQEKCNKEVIFFDVQVVNDLTSEVLVGGVETAGPEVLGAILQNLNLSNVDYSVGFAGTGNNLVRFFSGAHIHGVQLVFRKDFAESKVRVGLVNGYDLRKDIKYFEESVSISSHFCRGL